MRWWHLIGWTAFAVFCLWASYDGEKHKKDRYSDNVLRRCEEDAEFRERLREALGVHP